MGLMVVANDKNMKFKCTEYKNGEPYEWQRYIKNPFNGYFIHHMVLTSVKNDILLKKEFGLEKDKDYKMEFSFHRFSLDFAWPNEKICIEIDGEQHERFQEQKERDVEKDKLLKEEGWTELRKPWKEIFNNPKTFIEEVRCILE